MYKEVVSPILDKLDSETMHVAARRGLNLAAKHPLTQNLLDIFDYEDDEASYDDRLHVYLAGTIWRNPVMVGAGWDKTGEAVVGLSHLGFSGVEVGSVLRDPQPGNPKPRQFMIGPGVALNRLGFNSPGMEVVASNLDRLGGTRYIDYPVGISVGKNKNVPDSEAPQAHADVVRRLYEYATYFAINVSSPNTPGLRRLQDKEPLTDIVQAVNEAMDEQGDRIPTYVKIAPDLTNNAVDDVLEVAIDNGVTGIIATNTTINPDIKAKYGTSWGGKPDGGLSGDDPEYRKMATGKIAYIYSQVEGYLDIIGVGGVKDAQTALEKIMAGAKMVQVVTAIRGEGPKVASNINRRLIHLMNERGVWNISDLVGAEAHKYA